MTTAELQSQLERIKAQLKLVKPILDRLPAELSIVHRAGYELARIDAAKSGWHLLDYDVMMSRKP